MTSQPFSDLVPVPISGKEALDQSLEPNQAIESEETGPAFLLAVGNVPLIEDIANVSNMVRDFFCQDTGTLAIRAHSDIHGNYSVFI